jgi:hypothetical protein
MHSAGARVDPGQEINTNALSRVRIYSLNQKVASLMAREEIKFVRERAWKSVFLHKGNVVGFALFALESRDGVFDTHPPRAHSTSATEHC